MNKRLVFLALILCGQAHATDFSWHGYISQGLTQSIDSNFITDNNDITTDLTELGINGRWQLQDQLALVGQVNYLNGGNRFKSGGRVDYLFFDWQLPAVAGWQSRLHLGRFKNQHWLYSATRDVPHTRATAILPQSTYFDGFRDIALGSDGISWHATKNSEAGAWEVNWSYGKSPLNQDETNRVLGDQARGKGEQDFVHQFSVFYQPPTYNWRLGLSWLRSDFCYTAAPQDAFVDGKSTVDRWILSGMYFREHWEFSAELVKDLRTESGAYSPTFFNKRIGEGGYVQARYLINDKFSALVSYDTYTLNKDDPDGQRLEQQTGGLIPAYYSYQDTVAVGLRWDIAPRWRLQAEHHWVDGAGRSTGLLLPQHTQSTQPEWRMWAVQLMHWF